MKVRFSGGFWGEFCTPLFSQCQEALGCYICSIESTRRRLVLHPLHYRAAGGFVAGAAARNLCSSLQNKLVVRVNYGSSQERGSDRGGD